MEAALEVADTLYPGGLEIRPSQGLVLANGQAVPLTVREFGLLVAMVERIGSISTREWLYETVWGGEFGAASSVPESAR